MEPTEFDLEEYKKKMAALIAALFTSPTLSPNTAVTDSRRRRLAKRTERNDESADVQACTRCLGTGYCDEDDRCERCEGTGEYEGHPYPNCIGVGGEWDCDACDEAAYEAMAADSTVDQAAWRDLAKEAEKRISDAQSTDDLG